MNRIQDREAGSAVPTVNELLTRRSQIQGWLSRLESESAAENQRVVARIRSDYEQRLQGVVRELGAHIEALRSELAGARERQRSAEERYAAADDQLCEARLRHRIGELDAQAWEARRGELEEAVGQAEADRAGAVAEVDRLEEVLGQIEAGLGGGDGAGRPLFREAEAPAPDPRAEVETVADEPDPEPAPAPAPPPDAAWVAPLDDESTVLEPGAAEDLAFLEELDRAIAASDDTTDPHEHTDATGPRKGLKCPDCGYTNDVEAWYCGVCGVDLA